MQKQAKTSLQSNTFRVFALSGPHKSFNQLNLLVFDLKSSHYDNVHIIFNSLQVI